MHKEIQLLVGLIPPELTSFSSLSGVIRRCNLGVSSTDMGGIDARLGVRGEGVARVAGEIVRLRSVAEALSGEPETFVASQHQ